MVRHPIEDDLETLTVRRIHDRLEVRECPELRVDRGVVGNRVVAAKFALSVLHPDGLHRHEPQDVHA